MKATFKRLSSKQFSDKTGGRFETLAPGWFVVRSDFIPDKELRRAEYGFWYKLESEGNAVYRILSFAQNLKGENTSTGEAEIVIDFQGWLDLQGRKGELQDAIPITLSKVSRLKYPFMILHHPDSMIRIAAFFSLISLLLGVVSTLIAVVSAFML